jgi:hypothetical protein
VPFGSGAAALSRQTDVPVEQEVVPVRHGAGFVAQVWPAVQETQAPALQTRFAPQPVPSARDVPLSTHVVEPVAQEVTPARQAVGFVPQASPAVQPVHTPPLQTWSVPQTVPFCSGTRELSRHACVPVEQEVIPVRQKVGFVSQVTPALQTPHTPPRQTWSVPQVDPSCLGVPSRQTEVPVEQDVTPFMHAAFGLVVQATPALQTLHVPSRQTSGSEGLTSHAEPFAIVVAVFSHVCWPVTQEVRPVTHGFGFVEQAAPATQPLHAPLKQTSGTPASTSQIVPFGAGVGVSSHVCTPVPQEVVPRKHGVGFVLQVRPAVQEVHTPPLQTSATPGSTSQVVPFGLGPESRHSCVPVAQEVMPSRHAALGFVMQAALAVQGLHVPPLQTWFVPQLVPFGFAAPSMQTCVPVSQEVMPSLQAGSGFVVQAALAVQVEQMPPLHTWFVPQSIPFDLGVPSTHSEVPVAQDVTPLRHAGFGLLVQAALAVQALHVPPLQTWFVPHVMPSGLAAPSMQSCVPVLHEVMPSLQAVSGLSGHVTPAVQALQAPAPLHTRFVPQTVPGALFVAVFSQVSAPVAQDVTPSTHGFEL